jgi:hypothetical protein
MSIYVKKGNKKIKVCNALKRKEIYFFYVSFFALMFARRKDEWTGTIEGLVTLRIMDSVNILHIPPAVNI